MLVICLDIPATTIPPLVATVDFPTTTIAQQDLNSTPLTTILVVIITGLTLLLLAIIVIAIARKCKKRMKKTDARVVEEVYYSTIPDLPPNPVTINTPYQAQDIPPELPATCPASNDGGENIDMIENEAYLTRREAGLEIQCNTAM